MDQFVRDFRPPHFAAHKVNNVRSCDQILQIAAKDSITVMNTNICSIAKNLDELLVYLDQLSHKFDIICLTETWQIKNINDFRLNDYNIYYSEGMYNQNDGVIMYVRQEFEQEARTIKIGEIDAIECSVVINNKKTIQSDSSV